MFAEENSREDIALRAFAVGLTIVLWIGFAQGGLWGVLLGWLPATLIAVPVAALAAAWRFLLAPLFLLAAIGAAVVAFLFVAL